jgi:AraC-like DNA-binding protein
MSSSLIVAVRLSGGVRDDGPHALDDAPETLAPALARTACCANSRGMTDAVIHTTALRARLLARLAPLRASADQDGALPYGATAGVSVFGYCVRTQERVARMGFDSASLVVVLSGTKEIWHGETVERFAAGEPFVLPAGVEYDLVNVPDPRSGRYESLCIRADAAVRDQLGASLRPMAYRRAVGATLAVPLSEDLVEAYGHAASVLSPGDAALAGAVARHRVLEILLLVGRTHLAVLLGGASRIERVEAVIRSDPGRRWRVAEVARALNLGDSTLRRQLGAAGTSFRQILLRVRMTTAAELLAANRPVTQAAQAAGYRSRSHFARHVRAAYGALPRVLRKAG